MAQWRGARVRSSDIGKCWEARVLAGSQAILFRWIAAVSCHYHGNMIQFMFLSFQYSPPGPLVVLFNVNIFPISDYTIYSSLFLQCVYSDSVSLFHVSADVLSAHIRDEKTSGTS